MSRGPETEAPVATLATQIVQAAVRPDVSVAELGSLAEHDPAFVIRALSVVNSAAYGLARKVTDIRHAASLLGIRALRNIALSLSLFEMAPLGAAGDALLAICVRRAAAARLIAVSLGEKQPDEYFTVGLLLEVGVLVRARHELAAAAELARSPASVRTVRERAMDGSPHPLRGAELATAWKLSEDLIEAIAHHHDVDPPASKLGGVAWAAERVAGVFEGGDLSANRDDAVRALLHLRIEGARAETVLQELPARVLDIAATFQRELGPQPDVDTLLRDANAGLVELNRNYQELVRTLERTLSENEALSESLRKANEQLAKIAATDELTNLLNRRALQEALRKDLFQTHRSKSTISLLMSDIDHFKRVNDAYGHQLGDEVLRVFAHVINSSIRGGDTAARYGGEEFCILLPHTPLENAVIVAERMRSALASTLFRAGPAGQFNVTASFGVAAVSGPGCERASDDLIRRADEALYAAKHAGRNRVVTAK